MSTSVEVIKGVSEESGVSQKEIKKVLDSVEKYLKEQILTSDDLDFKIIDLKFNFITKCGRRARNLKTGEEIYVPEHKDVKIRTSSNFKELVKSLRKAKSE